MAIDTETLTSTDRIKLKSFMDTAIAAFQEIDDRKDSLKDAAKAIAEEFGWKPGTLMKAARVAYKVSIEAEKEQFDTVEEILEVTGRR